MTSRRLVPDEVWLTDVNEHPTVEGKLYCCAIKDLFSNRIVGYSLSDRVTAQLATSALRSDVARRQPHGTVLVHSDRGSQGGFKWSSQHLERRGCDAQQEPTEGGPPLPGTDPFAGKARCGVARGPCPVLGSDCSGLKTDDAGVEAGISSPVAYRWFRHAGGVNPCLPQTVTGRYLSFAEREDIAIWHAQEVGVREIAQGH